MCAQQDSLFDIENGESILDPLQERADMLARYLSTNDVRAGLTTETVVRILDIEQFPESLRSTLTTELTSDRYGSGPIAPELRTLEDFSAEGKPVEIAYRFEDVDRFRVSEFYPDANTGFFVTGTGEPAIVCLPPTYIGAMSMDDYEYYRTKRAGLGFSSTLKVNLDVSRILKDYNDLDKSYQSLALTPPEERDVRDKSIEGVLKRWFHRSPDEIILKYSDFTSRTH